MPCVLGGGSSQNFCHPSSTTEFPADDDDDWSLSSVDTVGATCLSCELVDGIEVNVGASLSAVLSFVEMASSES